MFPPGMNFSDAVALVGLLAPASNVAGTYATGAVNTALHGSLGIVLNAAGVGGGTITLSVLASATSGGSYTAVGSLNIPAALAAAGVQIYNLRADFLSNSGVGPFIKVQAVNTQTCVFGIEVWGVMERQGPASDNNAAAVLAVGTN